jgi:ABC-type Mn2+/Zn2+ transport system ATPase subunit
MGILNEILKTDSLVRRRRSPHQEDAPILRVQNLRLQYASGAALEDITFELRTGERLAVVGPNGAGKSTLFKIIAGLIKPHQGLVEVFGNDPEGHICIAYVPQRSQVDWNFPATVREVVMMGRVGKMGLFRWPRQHDRQTVQHALEIVRLDHLANRQIGELSGGQQQRMFIAQALAQEAELMLLDEPFTGLDVTSLDEIFQILDRLQEQRVTSMVALHDLELAAERFDRVMLLNHQMLGLGSPQEVFQTQNLLQAYGSKLRLLHTPEGLLALDDTCCDDDMHFHHSPDA